MQLEDIAGVRELWSLTRGQPEVVVCLLDGPVDLSQSCFSGVRFSSLDLGISLSAQEPKARAHGTHTASLIFANHRSDLRGAAPDCRGIVGTLFRDFDPEMRQTCSSSVLAFAIRHAMAAGARIINISAGLLSGTDAVPIALASALAECETAGVLVVAAAGNDGCDCTHIPAGVGTVLAVGAMDRDGGPAPFSNWGASYATHGILAPGVDIVGAGLDGKPRATSGTSQAAAIVSGVAALLTSLHFRRTGRVDPLMVGRLLRATASACGAEPEPERCLGGRLDVKAALAALTNRGSRPMEIMTDSMVPGLPATPIPPPVGILPAAVADAARAQVEPLLSLSDCGCAGTAAQVTACTCNDGDHAPEYVFPIGQIGLDFRNKTNRDSLVARDALPNPDDPAAVYRFLSDPPNAHLAEEFLWTLQVDGEPLYAIAPSGAFARDVYEALVKFLGEQEVGSPRPAPSGRGRRRAAGDEASVESIMGDRAEYVAIPGHIVGTTSLYMSGKQVDVLAPSLRGLANWNLPALQEAVAAQANALGETPQLASEDVLNLLRTMFSELRNEGRAPEDRAKNFVAINFAEPLFIFAREVAKGMALESIQVRPSPIRPAGTERWDVVLSFFKPTDQLGTAVAEYPITIDVNYVNPTIVRVGPPRQRSMRVIRTL